MDIANDAAASLDGEHSLANFPDCILLSILSLLDAPALARVAVVSRELAALVAANDDLWRALVQERFTPIAWAMPAGSLAPSASLEGEGTWRELYTRRSLPGERNWRCLAAESHATQESCWLVIGDAIYDVTEFMHRHPGMAASLQLFGGTDATEAFEEVPHSALAHKYMRTLAVPGLALPPEDFPPRFAKPDDSARHSWRFGSHLREITASALRMAQLREMVSHLPSNLPHLELPHLELPHLELPHLELPHASGRVEAVSVRVAEAGRAAAQKMEGATTAAKEYLERIRDPFSEFRASWSNTQLIELYMYLLVTV